MRSIPTIRLGFHLIGFNQSELKLTQKLIPWPLVTGRTMGLFPDTLSRGLRMRRECRERFPETDFKGNH